MFLRKKAPQLRSVEAKSAEPSTSSLVSQFSGSSIKRASILSQQHGAIDLSQGFPDDPTPARLKEAAISAIAQNRNQYAESWGTAALRKAIADKTNYFYGTDLNGDDHVTVTCGATEAMFAALLAVVEPGDDVILFEPAYENFRAQCLMARANPVFVSINPDTFEIDFDQLEAAFSHRTAAIVLNTPNNPTGKIFSRAELERISQLCEKHNAIAISDETYEHMVYDGYQHISLATMSRLDGGYFRDRWIVVSSCSKTYLMTGWRIGYTVSAKKFTSAIRRCSDYLSGVAATPLQDAATIAMQFDDSYYSELLENYTMKRGLLVNILNDCGLKCTPPQGGYFILADMSAFAFEDSVMFSEYLMKKIGVAAVPWRAFYKNADQGRYRIRFTFSKTKETILAAAERLKKLADTPRR